MEAFLGQAGRLGPRRLALCAALGAATLALLAAVLGASRAGAPRSYLTPPVAGPATGARAATEDAISARVEGLVDSLVGPGRARVFVNADVDERQVTTEQEAFDPASRVLRPDLRRRQDPSGAQGPLSPTGYESSRTITRAVQPPGAVRRLSVAVAVDGARAAGRPLSPQELERIGTLVKAAVGFSAARGDEVQVFDVRFAPGPGVAGAGYWAPPAAIAAAAALAALVLALTAMSLGRALGARSPGSLGARPHASAAEAVGGAPADGLAALRRASEFAESHPEASARVLKSWLREVA